MYFGGHQDNMCPGWYIHKTAETAAQEAPGRVLFKVWDQGKHVKLLMDFPEEYNKHMTQFCQLLEKGQSKL
jgi:hypothetical protein